MKKRILFCMMVISMMTICVGHVVAQTKTEGSFFSRLFQKKKPLGSPADSVKIAPRTTTQPSCDFLKESKAENEALMPDYVLSNGPIFGPNVRIYSVMFIFHSAVFNTNIGGIAFNFDSMKWQVP